MTSLSHLTQNVDFRWECPFTKTGKRSAHSTCAKAFAQEMDFQLIETSDDGNCFFYTLSKFGKRANYAPLLLDQNEHRNARLLREQLVDHIEQNIEKYIPFLLNNDNNLSPENQITELRENGAWASSAGDLVPFAGANAFGIHINLYNILVLDSRDEIQLNPIRSEKDTSVFVSIMRVREGHFQLLWPRSGQIQSNRSNVSTQASVSVQHHPKENIPDALHAAHLAVQAAQIAVDAAKKNTGRNHSLISNERKLNQMIKNLNQLSVSSAPRRSTRSKSVKPSVYSAPSKTKRSTRSTVKKNNQSLSSSIGIRNNHKNNNNNNNNNLRRALEESMRYP